MQTLLTNDFEKAFLVKNTRRDDNTTTGNADSFKVLITGYDKLMSNESKKGDLQNHDT